MNRVPDAPLSVAEVVAFEAAWDRVAAVCHRVSREHGWWPESDRNDGEAIALMHSELSEALEWLRKGEDVEDDKIMPHLGVEAELADVVIRIMDHARGRGWDVAGAILAKIQHNETREHKHGNKRF